MQPVPMAVCVAVIAFVTKRNCPLWDLIGVSCTAIEHVTARPPTCLMRWQRLTCV